MREEVGPGLSPDPCMYEDECWKVRAVPAGGRIFFYVDGPYGEPTAAIESNLDWSGFAAMLPDPLFVLGDWAGVPEAFRGRPVFKHSASVANSALPFFYHVRIAKSPKPITDCKYRSSFVGAYTHPIRERLMESFAHISGDVLIAPNLRPWWEYPAEGREGLRRMFLDVLDETAFPICPRGKGLTSIRFFEALRMGRIPVLVADEIALPLPRLVDWEKICVRVPEGDVGLVGEYLDRWQAGHDLAAASAEARRVSLEYFEDTEKFIRISLEGRDAAA